MSRVAYLQGQIARCEAMMRGYYGKDEFLFRFWANARDGYRGKLERTKVKEMMP